MVALTRSEPQFIIRTWRAGALHLFPNYVLTPCKTKEEAEKWAEENICTRCYDYEVAKATPQLISFLHAREQAHETPKRFLIEPIYPGVDK